MPYVKLTLISLNSIVYEGNAMSIKSTITTLPDGREIYCVNAYEVDFSVNEIFNDELLTHGIKLPIDGTFIDVGANIGLFSLFLLDKCPQSNIFAYEPMPEPFFALQKNLTGKAQVFSMGLGIEPGELLFEYFPGISALSSSNPVISNEMSRGLRRVLLEPSGDADVNEILDKTGANQRIQLEPDFVEQLFVAQKVIAPIDTLSNQIDKLDIHNIDLLKIDTEGSEKDVLAGITEAHWLLIQQLVVEVHLGKEETYLIEQEFKNRGYKTAVGFHPLASSGAPVFHIYAAR